MFTLKNLLIVILSITQSASYAIDNSNTDQQMIDQKAACDKNTAMTWDTRLNRCVGKQEARKTRNDSKACNEIKDIGARKACHLNLASNNTGVSSDPNQVGSGVSKLQTQSTIINTASTIVSALNYFAKDGANSNCMSKSILGITSLGGFLTDIYLKIQTKKKLNELQGKYQLDNQKSPYNAQVTALQYLKEEQETVKDIASLEKKRQMLLMIGYGAAAVTAGYEMFTSPTCGNGPKPASTGDAVATASDSPPPQPAPAAAATTVADSNTGADSNLAETQPVLRGEVQGNGLASLEEDSSPASSIDQRNGSDIASDSYSKHSQLESIRDGNVVRNVIKDSNGNVTGVVHNGQVYESFSQNKNGQWMAQGKPSGVFNYNDGTFGSNRVNGVAITSNYTYNTGRLSSGSGTTQVRNTSFGTNKAGK